MGSRRDDVAIRVTPVSSIEQESFADRFTERLSNPLKGESLRIVPIQAIHGTGPNSVPDTPRRCLGSNAGKIRDA